MKKETYDILVENGFVLSELNGVTKKPKLRRKSDNVCNDRTIPWDESKLFIAIPGHQRLIIDVDVKNGKQGLKSLKKLEDDLLLDLTKHVRTPSGGYHIYCKIDKPIRANQKNYPDIDFQCYRHDTKLCAPFVVAGDQNLTDKKRYELINAIKLEYIDSDIFDLDNEAFEDDISFSVADLHTKKTKEEVEQLLKYVPADDYLDWIANCAAIRRELGNTKEAFEVFHKWSKTSENYDSRESCLTKWKDLSNTPSSARTVGTIYYVATNNKLNKLKLDISNSKSLEDLEKTLSKKYITEYPPIKTSSNVEELSKIYKQTYQNITNVTCNINKARSIINSAFKTNLAELVKSKITSWVDDIMFVDSFLGSNKYYRLSTNKQLSEQALSGIYCNELNALSKAQGKKVSIKDLQLNNIIKTATAHEYNPSTEARTYIDDLGNIVLNTYNSLSRPPIASSYTNKGLELISLFEKHIKTVLTEEEGDIFLDYLSYITQNFGEKVLWVPLIQSTEGLGKTMIGDILINHVFGKLNAGVADSNVIIGGTTGWATNKSLRILEELKVSGHNRFEIMNQLKPLVTNHIVSRVEKYEVSTEIANKCNFIAFTNHKDALPIDSGDRRWWTVFSRVSSLKQLEEITGKTVREYFKPLQEDLAIRNSAYGPEFHLWLLNRKISPDFSPTNLPHSDHKETIIMNELGKMDGLVELRDLINDGFIGVNRDILSTKQLIKLLESTDESGEPVWREDIPKTKQLSRILTALGFQKLNRRLTFEKTRHYIWYKPTIPDNEINEAFKKSTEITSQLDSTDFEQL